MKIITTLLILLLSINSFTQCNLYQVYESFGTTTLTTQGGSWAQNSMITVTSPVRTGGRAIGFNASGDWIRTPLISSPGIFSFWRRRSSNTTSWSCILETSPNGTTWTTRATITSITGTYQQYSINLGALGLTNVYVRLRDNRASGAHERYIDDLSWTSTNSTQNTLLPIVGDCSQTITSQISIIDMGSYLETYNNNITQTVTFTVSDPTKLLELNISTLNIETDYDYLYVYDGPNTSSPLLATLTGTNSDLTYVTSQSNSSITIRFTTDISNIGTWSGFEATINQVLALPVELLSFEGKGFSNYNVLNWSTASESNTDKFVIKKSQDGIFWESVGTVPASGNSTQKIDYILTDINMVYELNYYELHQYDLNGVFKVYGPISINNLRKEKRVVKVVNLLGQDVDENESGVLIEVYEDGTVNKIIR